MPEAQSTPAPRYRRYLLWLAVMTVVLYPLPYLLIHLPHFGQWTTSPFGRDLEYTMTTGHIDADVLIYGDSTALYGLNPRRMSSELGVKVFNLPNVLPSLRATYDLGLKQYLAHNKRPRLIVLYLAPWDLDYANFKAEDTAYDGEEMLLRHGNAQELWGFARKHPDLYLQFPFTFYRVQVNDRTFHRDYSLPEVATTLGQRAVPAFAPLPADCALPPARAAGHLPMQTALDLYREYNQPGMPAMVYVAPIPHCVNAAIVAEDNYAPLHAAAPRLMPPGDFVQDTYYAHPVPGKVDQLTDQLLEAIRPRLAEQSKP